MGLNYWQKACIPGDIASFVCLGLDDSLFHFSWLLFFRNVFNPSKLAISNPYAHVLCKDTRISTLCTYATIDDDHRPAGSSGFQTNRTYTDILRDIS